MTTNFNQKRFVDLGQAIYVEWVKGVTGLATVSEEERREVFNEAAGYAFEAAEEFAKVFEHQEDN